jgi:hypothetical protein
MNNRLLYLFTAAVLAACCCATPTEAITLDGTGIPSEGLTLRATQDSPTGYGDSLGGLQDSAGGSELDQLFADVDNLNGILNLGITGNLEGNFNKMWIFFDAVPGGENVLSGDNVDGGCCAEISHLAGLTFPSGVTMDHGLRLEVGSGFLGVNFFDLITNTAQNVFTGGGPGDLPLSASGGPKGVTFGWDNSNILGVTGVDAAGASSATTGFEFSIDLVDAFNGSQGNINVAAFITSGDGTNLSNQILPGIGGGGNPGAPGSYTLPGVVTVPGDPLAGHLLGDVDDDGDVDLVESVMDGDGVSDFDIIRMNWLETNASFGMTLLRSDGDLNENGEVGIEDFREWKNACTLVSCATGAGMAAAFASLGAGGTVPEPTSAALAIFAGIGLMTGARKRQRRTTSRAGCDA